MPCCPGLTFLVLSALPAFSLLLPEAPSSVLQTETKLPQEPEPELCNWTTGLVNTQALSPPAWCNVYNGDEAACNKAYFYKTNTGEAQRCKYTSSRCEANHSTTAYCGWAWGVANGFQPTPPPYPPLNPINGHSTPISDFSKHPPVPLVAEGSPPPGPLLAGGPLTTEETGFRLRRNILSFTGRDLTIQNVSGTYLYGTEGDIFTAHKHTYLYDGVTGRQLAMVTKTFWTFHKEYEIHAFEPICAGQRPEVETGPGGAAIFRFGRMTELIFTLYTQWTLQRYNCGGGMTKVWDIKSTYWVSALHHYSILENGDQTVGTIDQSYFFQFSANYDVWITKNEDQALLAASIVIVDIVNSQKEQERANDASSSAHGGGTYGGDGGSDAGAGR